MSIRRDDLEAGNVDLSEVIDTRRGGLKLCAPGEVLRSEFLEPMQLSAYRLAKDIHVPINRVAGILAGRRDDRATVAGDYHAFAFRRAIVQLRKFVLCLNDTMLAHDRKIAI